MTLNSNILSHSLAIIPARGGSKGLPRKNVRELGGIPLIAHTIRAAQKSRIERVIVSTDDDEIAEISLRWGAEVPFVRPVEHSGDSATSLSVLLHALHFMEENESMQVDHVVFLQPTSPFRSTQHINEALDNYLESEATSLISVTDVQEFHPYFMFTQHENHRLEPLHQINPRPLRRQDLPPIYRINGALYICKRSYYQDLPPNAAIFDWENLSSFVMDAPSSVDINDFLDFQRAELLLGEQSGGA